LATVLGIEACELLKRPPREPHIPTAEVGD
jgi:hypothetical protein